MARRDDRAGAGQTWAPPGTVATGQGGPTGETGRTLRTLALVAVVVGLVALTSAACVLSYSSVHDFALRAGISRPLAKIYPDIGDAMLVIAGCSVLALRGAGLVSRVYGWLCFILLLGALAASGVAHEAGLNMPLRAAEITAAVFPWALVLVAFGLLLAMLRHVRRRRGQRATSASADTLMPARAAIEPPALEPPTLEAGEPGAYTYEAGYDIAVYEGASEYEDDELYDYAEPPAAPVPTAEPASPEPPAAAVPTPEPPTPEPPSAEPNVVSPTVPYPRPAVEPDDMLADSPESPATQPQKAVARPAEMQLRARTPRQADPAGSPAGEPSATDPPTAEPTPPAGSLVTEPPTSGFTGDTIPRGELNPAPTPEQPKRQPPELDRPRSSPTPPS